MTREKMLETLIKCEIYEPGYIIKRTHVDEKGVIVIDEAELIEISIVNRDKDSL